MKTPLTLAFSLISFFSFCQLDSILFDGAYRTYAIHIPPSYDGSLETDLVVGMHGGFGNGEQFEDQSMLSEKSDEAGFIAVYPNGTGYLLAPNLRFWNAGVCCGYATENDIDDVGFISDLIDSLSTEYNINSQRVFATGMSNGAQMSYRLACEIPEKIAAIAPVAGSLQFMPCTPIEPVPVIHFHSTLDSNVPYQGGVGDGPSQHYNPPLDSVLTAWSEHDGCSEFMLYDDFDGYSFSQWSSCECLYTIDYYLTEDGGHSWPGGNGTVIGDDPSEVINANDLMWEFFLMHDNNCNATSIEEEFDYRPIHFYPNPAGNHVTIVSEIPSEIVSISLISTKGDVIELAVPPKRTDGIKWFVQLKLSLDSISPGIYVVRVQAADAVHTKRLLVN